MFCVLSKQKSQCLSHIWIPFTGILSVKYNILDQMKPYFLICLFLVMISQLFLYFLLLNLVHVLSCPCLITWCCSKWSPEITLAVMHFVQVRPLHISVCSFFVPQHVVGPYAYQSLSLFYVCGCGTISVHYWCCVCLCWSWLPGCSVSFSNLP